MRYNIAMLCEKNVYSLRFFWNDTRDRIKIRYQLDATQKARIDSSILVLNTTLASKLGFAVPNLQCTNKSHTKIALYPDAFDVKNVDINCTLPRCSTMQTSCAITVNAEILPGSPAEETAAEISANQTMANLVRDLTDLDKEIEGYFKPGIGSGLESMELELKQPDLLPEPWYLKSPSYERKRDSAIVARLDLSQRNVNTIKPSDVLCLQPNEPFGIMCSLRSSQVFIRLTDSNGNSVP